MLPKSRKRSIQKRSFLLFELLLAVGLLMLCLFPMVKTHVSLAKEQMKQVRALEFEQEVRAALFHLKEDLHAHTFTWEELMKGEKKTGAYTLKKKKQSTKKLTDDSGLLLTATLHLRGKNIERMVYVEKTRPYAH